MFQLKIATYGVVAVGLGTYLGKVRTVLHSTNRPENFSQKKRTGNRQHKHAMHAAGR